MAYQPYQLSKKEQAILNQGLSDCDAIKQDLERAKMAGVPNVDHIEAALETCQERINKLKATYGARNK